MNQAATMTEYQETPARFSVEEFLELVKAPPIANWRGKIELVEGVITRMSPANIPHWNAQRITYMNLYEALKDLSADWIVGQEPSVKLFDKTMREPDVAILRASGISGEIFDRTALYLAVEIADTSLPIDLGAKLKDYADAFVPHYWVVDINARQVRVMSDPRNGNYLTKSVVDFGAELSIPGLDRSIFIM